MSRRELAPDTTNGRWWPLVIGLGGIAVATYKQIPINALASGRGGASATVALVLGIMACAGMTGAFAKAAESDGAGTAGRWLLAVVAVQSLTWLLLVVRTLAFTKQELRDTFVSVSYNVFGPLILLYPLAYLDRQGGAKLVRSVVWLTVPVLGIALAQAVVGPQAMPRLLQTDVRVFTVVNAAGIERVNGLVGNHIEFGLFAVLVLNYLYAVRRDLPRWVVVLLEVGWLSTVVIASSRVFMLLAAGTVSYWRGVRGSWASRWVLVIGAVVVLLVVREVREYLAVVLLATGNESALHSSQLHGWMIRTAINGMAAHPLLGEGIGSQAGAAKVVTDGWLWAMGLEAGLVGVVSFLAVPVAAFAILSKRAIVEARAQGTTELAQAALVAYAAVLAAATLDSSLGNQANTLLLYLLVGCGVLPVEGQPQ